MLNSLLHYDICVDQFMKWINFREDTERHIAVFGAIKTRSTILLRQKLLPDKTVEIPDRWFAISGSHKRIIKGMIMAYFNT